MKNKERAWVNLGDVNFLEYGGCLTRKGIREDAYEVISLTTGICDYEGKYKNPCIVARCYIADINDWIFAEINSCAGYDKDFRPETEDQKMSYCVDIINYYGIHEFDPVFPKETGCGPYALGTIKQWVVGKTIVKRFLKENDVPYEFRHQEENK